MCKVNWNMVNVFCIVWSQQHTDYNQLLEAYNASQQSLQQSASSISVSIILIGCYVYLLLLNGSVAAWIQLYFTYTFLKSGDMYR